MAASRNSRRASSRPEKKARPEKEVTTPSGRSLWTGQLRLALVTIPVQLISAVKSGGRLSFHQIDSKSHKRIRYQKIVPGTGPVDTKNIVKGFELSKGNYVFITDEDLDTVKLEAKHTIDLVQFVDHCEIDPIYFDQPYFVVAGGKIANEAYTVLRETMRASGKMGIGQFVMRGREHIAALKPYGDGLLLETLRFADEVRDALPFFRALDEVPPDGELLDMARDLIQRKTRKFDAARFHDRYTEALRELIAAKAKNKVVVDEATAATDEERGNVIDLVEALRQSLRANQSSKAPPAPKAQRVRKTRAR